MRKSKSPYLWSWWKRMLRDFVRQVIQEHEQAVAWTRATCPYCSVPLSTPDAAYCSVCGAPLHKEPHTDPAVMRIIAAGQLQHTGDLGRIERDKRHIPREDTQMHRAVRGLPTHYAVRERESKR